MSKNKHITERGFNRESGKSLIEIILVLLIVVIVGTFAIGQYRTAKTDYARQNMARLLKINMERARFDSVKRRSIDPAQQAKVIIDRQWFSVAADSNGNGVIDSADTEVTSLKSDNLSIAGQDMNLPVTLAFDNRGNVASAKDSSGANINPIFYLCNGDCTAATVTPSNSNIVLVSPAGTVNLLDGDAALPTFSNPSVTTVAGDAGVNCQVAVSLASCGGSGTPGSATPVSTPSATPATTPTESPSPTSTETPIETTTPEATPTPIACVTDQKPALTKCWCAPPMTVKKNGKCN